MSARAATAASTEASSTWAWVTKRMRRPLAKASTPHQLGREVGEAAGQPARQCIVAAVAAIGILQGDDGRRGQKAGLAHAATQHAGGAPRLPHEIHVARQDGADRPAEALAQREPHRIDVTAELADRCIEEGGGVEQPCAIEMDGKAGPPRDGMDGRHGSGRHHRAARGVVRVLEANEPRRCQRQVGGPADRWLDVVWCEKAARALDRARHGAGQDREPTALGIVDMGRLLDDHLAAAAVVGDQRRQVGHGARRQEQRLVLAGQR